jgi:integrase/recombinase XerD
MNRGSRTNTRHSPGSGIVSQLCRIRHSRHGFAVQRLLAWYADNLDVRAMIPHLSVYLGHLSKEETYWYLTATPELLTAAGEAFRRSCEPGGDS